MGVVEIGSRAVRLLVADVGGDVGLSVVRTGWLETGLAETMVRGDYSLRQIFDVIGDKTRGFLEEARRDGSAAVLAFGTAGLRAAPKELLAGLCSAVPELTLMSARDEAWCSLVAAVMGLQGVIERNAPILVVDQGSGSMEVALGQFSGGRPVISVIRSYELGYAAIAETLSELDGDLPALRSRLTRRLSRHSPIDGVATARPVVMGSVATKLAWLAGAGAGGRYRPGVVHGRTVGLSEIDVQALAAVQEPARLRERLDPGKPGSREFERVIAGMVGLELFLRRVGKEEFVVSAHGTRHGLAWKLGLAGEDYSHAGMAR